MNTIIRLEASLSIIVAYLISAIFNYLFHRKYTFVSTSNITSEIVNNITSEIVNNITSEIVKFILIAVSMAYLTVYIATGLMDIGISIYLGKLVAVLVVFVMTFFISKYFIYYQKIQ
jgi:putative flippase GtrA